MVYETLNTAQLPQAANKPHYTPASAFKKAFKVLRKVFRHTPRHQKLQDESILDISILSTLPAASKSEWALHTAIVRDAYDLEALSTEECQNYANERLEAEAHAAANITTLTALNAVANACV